MQSFHLSPRIQAMTRSRTTGQHHPIPLLPGTQRRRLNPHHRGHRPNAVQALSLRRAGALRARLHRAFRPHWTPLLMLPCTRGSSGAARSPSAAAVRLPTTSTRRIPVTTDLCFQGCDQPSTGCQHSPACRRPSALHQSRRERSGACGRDRALRRASHQWAGWGAGALERSAELDVFSATSRPPPQSILGRGCDHRFSRRTQLRERGIDVDGTFAMNSRSSSQATARDCSSHENGAAFTGGRQRRSFSCAASVVRSFSVHGGGRDTHTRSSRSKDRICPAIWAIVVDHEQLEVGRQRRQLAARRAARKLLAHCPSSLPRRRRAPPHRGCVLARVRERPTRADRLASPTADASTPEPTTFNAACSSCGCSRRRRAITGVRTPTSARP